MKLVSHLGVAVEVEPGRVADALIASGYVEEGAKAAPKAATRPTARKAPTRSRAKPTKE